MDESENAYSEEDFQFIKKSLKRCLLGVSDEKIQSLATDMAKDGITKALSCHVRHEDIIALGLNKYQANALVNYWKPRGEFFCFVSKNPSGK